MIFYALTIFLSAFLLFQIQPMIAKMILPWFGGSAAVWITAMLFFQTMLLGGYLYAHSLIRFLKLKTQMTLHVFLLVASVAFLPVWPPPAWKPTGVEEPIMRILGLLTLSVGLPYFLLSTTSPLVQAWYSRKYHSALPYRLFALSNLASLLGLLAYPFILEPYITLKQQSLVWSVAYAVFTVLCIVSALISRPGAAREEISRKKDASPADDEAGRSPGAREQILWLVLAGCASAILLAVTNHLTQNVASIPFLWIVPLSLYLLTFILTFDFEQLYSRKIFVWLLPIGLCAMSYGLWNKDPRVDIRLVVAVFSAGLFICCMFCHGELVKRKPSPRYLTSFYLMLSAGGASGGLLVGLAAPNLLHGYFELPIALMACALLLLLTNEYRRRRFTAIAGTAVGLAAAVSVVLAGWQYISSYKDTSRVMMRNFYGSLRVMEYAKGTADETRALIHGMVIHGKQFTKPDRRHEHITYYSSQSGFSLALQSISHAPLRVGIIGLGAGALASFAKPGDVFRFYEINPLVEKLAREEFTYLADCLGKIEVVIADGRLALERELPQQYDLLAVDAFSGDAIPVHLISEQAVQLYFGHLKPDGILALHITNAHLNMEPVVEKLARVSGKHAVVVMNENDPAREIYRARWALLSSEPFQAPQITKAAAKLESRPDMHVWTDDYSNLFQILK